MCVTLDLNDTVKIGYGLGGFCWIKNGTALLAIVGVPVALVILFNFIALTWTVISIHKVRKVTNKLTDQGNQSSLALLYIKLTCVLGLTWVFGFLSSIVKTDATAYLFVAINSLQGFFICLTFVAKKRTVALLRGPRKKHHESGHSNNTLDTKL
ncbi:G-protein coupled receptor Mth2-like isoform X1 [Oculina patagonica]